MKFKMQTSLFNSLVPLV